MIAIIARIHDAVRYLRALNFLVSNTCMHACIPGLFSSRCQSQSDTLRGFVQPKRRQMARLPASSWLSRWENLVRLVARQQPAGRT